MHLAALSTDPGITLGSLFSLTACGFVLGSLNPF